MQKAIVAFIKGQETQRRYNCKRICPLIGEQVHTVITRRCVIGLRSLCSLVISNTYRFHNTSRHAINKFSQVIQYRILQHHEDRPFIFPKNDSATICSMSPTINHSCMQRDSNALMAHSTMLPYLPPEVIIGIFEAIDSFPTALALSTTCHPIHNVWIAHANTILPSVVECCPQAQDLAHAQREARTSAPLVSTPKMHVTIAARIPMNANFASHILRHYEIRVVRAAKKRGITREELTLKERADFLRAAYRAMILTCSNAYSPARSFLESLDMLEYMQMKEAMDFLCYWFHKAPVCEIVRDDFFKPGESALAVSWTQMDLLLFHLHLMHIPGHHEDFQEHESKPFGYFTVADGYQAKAGSTRGERLADLLPLMMKDSFSNHQLTRTEELYGR